MPPVTSVNVERTKYLLPAGTVASDRRCVTDQRGCCVDQHIVPGVGNCAVGDGFARDWELPEAVYLTARVTIPGRAAPYDGGEGDYPRSLLLSRQILSQVFPLTRAYLTRATHPWAILPTGYLNNLTEGWYWYWDLNQSADSGAPMNGINYDFGGITGYPFGWLAWRGNQGGPSGAECGKLKGRIDTGPVLDPAGAVAGPFIFDHAWWPGYYCGVSAAYREPDGNWTFVMGASDWIPKYRGITCTISAAPPGPAKPRRVSFRPRPLAGVLKLQFEEVTAPPLYTRQYYRYPSITYDWPRPAEAGTVYLERPAEGGDWAGETTLWGRPSRFLLCASHLPINVDFYPFCRDGWGLAVQVGDLARILTEASPGGSYPYYYYGPQTLYGYGGVGMLVDPGMSISTYYDGSPCQNGSAGTPPVCTLDPLDAEFDLPLTIQADAGVPPLGIVPYSSGINDQFPVSNPMPLLFRCRLTEGA